MSAEMLRRAAALMRERAEAARFWFPAEDHDGMDEVPWHTSEELRMDFDEEQGPHIASWHPAVALAVADWLDAEADESERLGSPDAPNVTPAGSTAYVVARAYLGSES